MSKFIDQCDCIKNCVKFKAMGACSCWCLSCKSESSNVPQDEGQNPEWMVETSYRVYRLHWRKNTAMNVYGKVSLP